MVSSRAVGVLVAMLMGWPAIASADGWVHLVVHLSPGAKVIKRQDARLVVRSASGAELIVGDRRAPNVHFYYELRRRRGRNPYRVWCVHPK